MATIVVTGFGLKVAGAGNPEEFTNMLLTGKSGLKLTSDFSLDGRSLWLGLVDDPLPELARRHRRYPRHAQFALASAFQAVLMAGVQDFTGVKSGIFIGNTTGSSYEVFSAHKKHFENGEVFSNEVMGLFNPHSSASAIAEAFGIIGLTRTISSGCTATLDAMQDALVYLNSGQLDLAIVGGSEGSLTPLAVDVFMGSVLKYGDSSSQYGSPFNSHSEGFIVAEGSGVLVLETEASALSRGARVLGVVSAVTSLNEAYSVFLPARTDAIMSSVVELALQGRKPTFINSQALGLSFNDRIEESWIQSMFLDTVPVTSVKGHVGHLIGASGAIQLISSLISLQHSFVPKVLRTDGNGYSLSLVLETLFCPVDSVLISSHGQGGNNASALLTSYPLGG